jgi:hypothetical protein
MVVEGLAFILGRTIEHHTDFVWLLRVVNTVVGNIPNFTIMSIQAIWWYFSSITLLDG